MGWFMFDKYPTLIETGFILLGAVLVLLLPFFMYGLVRLAFLRPSGSVKSYATPPADCSKQPQFSDHTLHCPARSSLSVGVVQPP